MQVVALFASAWIEIAWGLLMATTDQVALFASAWIEMTITRLWTLIRSKSHSL
ncbi:hypothetical protein M3626_00280 [Psychrobacillus sp. MER TA 17]|nr:hypothetical protein [Psychrobacillus sp. MER TA 17]